MVYQKTFMKEWKTYKIRDIATVNLSQYSLKEGWNEVTYLDTGSITENHIEDIQTFILPCDDFPSRARRKVQHNDILFSTVRPNQKHFGILKNPNDNLLVSTGFSVITVNPLVADANFVYYYITQQEIINYLQSVAEQSVSAYPSLKSSDIEDIDIELPSLYEQRRLALILKSIDDKIENNNRINHNLEEQARNIFLSYIDCDCVECPFSDLITVGSGGTPRTSESRFWNGDIPFFSPKDVSNSCFTLFTEKLITKDGLNNCNSSLYHENTTFITARGTVGKISLAGVSMAMNQSCFALTSKDNTPYFAYFLTERVVESLKKKANGAVFDAINSKDILQELVRVPNRDVIFQIEDRIRPYMNSIRFKSIENLYLTDTRDTLLPKLLSGELKINDLTC